MRQSVLIVGLIAVIIAAGMIFSANPIIEQQILASAQPQTVNNATTPTINSTKNIDNMTLPGQTVLYRGMVSSEEPIHLILPPGEGPHGASILPEREDGASYTGVLTFTATKPVEIGFGHRLHIDNSTLSQLDAKTLDDLLIGRHINRGEHAVPGIISVPSVLIPDYGSSPPYFSASIPFVGSSVWLRTPHGDPFIAVYEVVAEVVQPQAFVADIEGAMGGGINMTTTVINQTIGQP
jgi:hypothetical protein